MAAADLPLLAGNDPGPATEEARELARAVGLSFTVADALHRAGWEAGETLDRWLEPKLAQLTAPDGMADLEPAAERVGRAIRSGEPIAVFGDYDCDGITATAIVTEAIQALGGRVTPLLASRFAGGYGLSAPGLERVLQTDARLLITCDCGSADHERLAAAKGAGLDCVVIDHHLVPEEPLPAHAFLNPNRPDCGFPFKGLASCGLALILATALRRVMAQPLDVRRWLELVALGTVADVAPLEGDNRTLVRAGLARIAATERVGLSALALKGSRGRKVPCTAEDIAFQIAPRINAPGRLGDAKVALDALLEQDPTRAHALVEELDQITRQRRQLQETMIAEAFAEIAARGYGDDPAIVLARPSFHPGVVGIVAGRIADRLGKPAVVVGLDGTSGRGSARAPAGFRLYDSLVACSADLGSFGGHQAAAGVELDADQVDRFRDAWRQVCADQLAKLPAPTAPWRPDVRLDERDDVMQVLADLERLEPCGKGNPAPKLLMADVEVTGTRRIQTHLKLDLRLRGQRLSAFGPNLADLEPAVAGQRVALVGRLKRDWWRGGTTAEVLIETALRP
ncbi:MAG: single-stranded-DNA-specific exonuclease RecJ [Deltaproteobacteria bacterium]|nr:single-stranded-DNA-specific exonuclease RecJ [Deltaproteobacteria bacterium]